MKKTLPTDTASEGSSTTRFAYWLRHTVYVGWHWFGLWILFFLANYTLEYASFALLGHALIWDSPQHMMKVVLPVAFFTSWFPLFPKLRIFSEARVPKWPGSGFGRASDLFFVFGSWICWLALVPMMTYAYILKTVNYIGGL